MKIAVFLDVDKTLTQDFIQKEYAKALGCSPEYEEIESAFQRKQISSAEFGTKIIGLFAAKELTEEKAEQLFGTVRLQAWTEELLALEVDKYLVSSGPSYYIDPLAAKYRIPEKNVCRTVYRFDRRTRIIESCNAVDEQYKADFVRERVGAYDLTIGIGDNAKFDGPFVSHCTIPLLTVTTESTLHIPNFGAAIPLINKLLKLKEPGSRTFRPSDMSIPELVRSINVEGWVVLSTLLAFAFGLGAEWENIKHGLSHVIGAK
jgi:phosphoserine phosphatase